MRLILNSVRVCMFSIIDLFLHFVEGADPFGCPTLHRPWNEGSPMDAAKRRLHAAFEFFTKLGVRQNAPILH